MNKEIQQRFLEIMQSEYSILARLWKKRDRRTPHSKKWMRFDKKINNEIERGSRRFFKAGCYTADWHIRAYFLFLGQQQ